VLTRRKVHFALLSSDPDALARIMWCADVCVACMLY
jgi:hypothetical protein